MYTIFYNLNKCLRTWYVIENKKQENLEMILFLLFPRNIYARYFLFVFENKTLSPSNISIYFLWTLITRNYWKLMVKSKERWKWCKRCYMTVRYSYCYRNYRFHRVNYVCTSEMWNDLEIMLGSIFSSLEQRKHEYNIYSRTPIQRVYIMWPT